MVTKDSKADPRNWDTVNASQRLKSHPKGLGDCAVPQQRAQEKSGPNHGSFTDGHNTNIATPKYPGGGGTGV